jgi:hypothetical protein
VTHEKHSSGLPERSAGHAREVSALTPRMAAWLERRLAVGHRRGERARSETSGTIVSNRLPAPLETHAGPAAEKVTMKQPLLVPALAVSSHVPGSGIGIADG